MGDDHIFPDLEHAVSGNNKNNDEHKNRDNSKDTVKQGSRKSVNVDKMTNTPPEARLGSCRKMFSLCACMCVCLRIPGAYRLLSREPKQIALVAQKKQDIPLGAE